MAEITNFYEHKPESGDIKRLVILLHGLGSDGRDLIGLAPILAPHVPDTVFVSPDAPFPCDMAPFGHQWFSLQDRSPDKMLQGVQRAAPILDTFLTTQLEKYDLSADKMALAGFSQGTMMSLYVGPRYPEPLAGILGYSGALISEEDVPDAALHKIPVHLIHGEADDVVPVSAYHHARAFLEGHEFPVSGYTSPGLAHSIDEKGMASGAQFLNTIFT